MADLSSIEATQKQLKINVDTAKDLALKVLKDEPGSDNIDLGDNKKAARKFTDTCKAPTTSLVERSYASLNADRESMIGFTGR